MNFNISKVKIVVTAPIEVAEEIRLALGGTVAGIIGNYSNCTVSMECIGTFKGNNESNPVLGTKNQLEIVKEKKIEVQCNISKAKSVIELLRKIHPYEEPVIDIIPLINENDL